MNPQAAGPGWEASGRAKYILKLYVTGQSQQSIAAIENLRRMCHDALGGTYEMQVVDILEYPQLAEDERIVATPILIKELPPPVRRIIGDLSDIERVLVGLDLVHIKK